MGRTVVRRVEQPRRRKTADALIFAGAAAILLFAIIGVVSASAYVADRVSGHSPKTKQRSTSASGASGAVQDIARAQAQATAIVQEAQKAGQRIVAQASTHHRQVGQSNRSSHAAPASTSHAPSVAVALATATPEPVSQSASAPTTYPVQASAPPAAVPTAASSTGSLPSATGAVPDLSGVPSSWLVVGYNATFGSGPGSAGAISVINRSAKAFSGTAEVVYAAGGVASAGFSNLSPGQTLVLPLNGPAYGGGGYHIVMSGLH